MLVKARAAAQSTRHEARSCSPPRRCAPASVSPTKPAAAQVQRIDHCAPAARDHVMAHHIMAAPLPTNEGEAPSTSDDHEKPASNCGATCRYTSTSVAQKRERSVRREEHHRCRQVVARRGHAGGGGGQICAERLTPGNTALDAGGLRGRRGGVLKFARHLHARTGQGTWCELAGAARANRAERGWAGRL